MTAIENDCFEISISGTGVKITKIVSPQVAREIIALTMGASSPSVPARGSELPQAGRPASLRNSTDRISVREFLDGTEAKRYTEKIAGIGLFLMDCEDAEGFSKDDIQSRFRSAGEAPPQNFHRDFNGAVVNGWLAEDNKKPGSYYVTQKGRAAIDNKFANEKTTKPARKKSKKKAAKD